MPNKPEAKGGFFVATRSGQTRSPWLERQAIRAHRSKGRRLCLIPKKQISQSERGTESPTPRDDSRCSHTCPDHRQQDPRSLSSAGSIGRRSGWRHRCSATLGTPTPERGDFGCYLGYFSRRRSASATRPIGGSGGRHSASAPRVIPKSMFPRDLPRAVDRLIRKMLADQSLDRPDSAKKVAELVEPWTRGAGLKALVAEVPWSESRHKPGPNTSARQSLPTISLTRRGALGGVVAAAMAICLLPRPRWSQLFPPRLKRTEWRKLSPTAPEILLPVVTPDDLIYEVDARGNIEISSSAFREASYWCV